jgi:acyl-[acyl-carrier-protein]-phospholipid O-acyltransferase / long-chain-fatty-acid--[acyl-carrier-protein] ligase
MIALLRLLCRLLWRFRGFNTEVLDTPGPVLLIPNHVSWLDWLFIGVCLEGDWKFVVSEVVSRKSWLHRRIMVNRRTFPIDATSPYAVKHMAEFLQRGGRLVLFAEGRISETGSLMKLFDGTGFLLFKTRAKVITCYLRGANRLPWVKHRGWTRWFPQVTAHFSDVLTPPHPGEVSTTKARGMLTNWLRDRLIEHQFSVEMEQGPTNVLAAIAQAANERPGFQVLEDMNMQPQTYRRLFVGAELLASKLSVAAVCERSADSNEQRRSQNAATASNTPHPALSPRPTRGEGGRGPGEGCSQERIGVLLPNVNALPVLLLCLWSLGKVPAILNFSTGPAVMLQCARLAGLRQIITSREFLKRAKLDLAPLTDAGIELIYLEDLRAGISAFTKFTTLLRHTLFGIGTWNLELGASATAVILFTSGSEGVPKGVELTHGNLLANIRQMLAVTDLEDGDRIFNCLPLFHSFGLVVGALLPLVRGMYVFLYPSPLHYRIVPNAVYDRGCTVFLSTNTFLNGYARKSHPYDFRSVRLLVAAAEKLQDATAQLWARRFGQNILEGYGATECSPAVSLNVPMAPGYGSAGRFLPGIEWKLEPVEGVSEESAERETRSAESTAAATADSLSLHPLREEGKGEGSGPISSPSPVAQLETPNSKPVTSITTGRLFVRGPNVMKGYLNPDANAAFQSLGGWYDTGDIVHVDEEGFVHIRGRMKRFAKVSGEMVSLTAVEDALAGAFPQYGLRCTVAVISRPCEDKGEALIAVSNESRLQLDEIRAAIRTRGLSNLCVPREIKFVREIPKLGTGKVNHRELVKLVEQSK